MSALVLVLLAVVQGEVVLFGLWSGTCLGTRLPSEIALALDCLVPAGAAQLIASLLLPSACPSEDTMALIIRLAGT